MTRRHKPPFNDPIAPRTRGEALLDWFWLGMCMASLVVLMLLLVSSI